MNYAYIVNGIVHEIIPEENPDLPGFPIQERYSKEFVDSLVEIPEDIKIEQNWTYNDSEGFKAPIVEVIENSVEL